MGLVEIFGDGYRAGDGRKPLGHQHRRGPRRMSARNPLPSLPDALLHQPQIEAVLAEGEAMKRECGQKDDAAA